MVARGNAQHDQAYPGQSQLRRPEYARGGRPDRGKLYLRRGETGRVNHGLGFRGTLLSSVGRARRSAVRLVQIQLDRLFQRHEYLFVMRGDAPYKSIDDIRNAGEPPKCSSTALGSASYLTLKMLEEGLGVKFNIVTGYKGGQEQDLAIERGEVQCRGVTTAAYLGRGPMQGWVKKGFLRVLVQTPRKRNPKLPDVPSIHELMDRYRVAEKNRRIALVLLGSDNFGNFPTVASPGIPAERVKILREAYTKALKEPDLLDEAKKRSWEVEHISGEELQALAKEVIDQPADIVERIKQLLETK